MFLIQYFQIGNPLFSVGNEFCSLVLARHHIWHYHFDFFLQAAEWIADQLRGKTIQLLSQLHKKIVGPSAWHIEGAVIIHCEQAIAHMVRWFGVDAIDHPVKVTIKTGCTRQHIEHGIAFPAVSNHDPDSPLSGVLENRF